MQQSDLEMQDDNNVEFLPRGDEPEYRPDLPDDREALINLVEALRRAQMKMDHAGKDANQSHYGQKYATLHATIQATKKHLNDEGIYVQQISHESADGVAIETIFFGHGSTLGTGIVRVPCVRHDPQAFGAALTYARRYSLSLANNISSVDTDAEDAMQRNTPAHELIVPWGRFKDYGWTLGKIAQNSLGYLKYLASDSAASAGFQYQKEAREVFEQHFEPLSSDEISDTIADADHPDQIKDLWRLMDGEQRTEFESQCRDRKAELTPVRTAENARG
jgi:hypothetical protein